MTPDRLRMSVPREHVAAFVARGWREVWAGRAKVTIAWDGAEPAAVPSERVLREAEARFEPVPFSERIFGGRRR